MSNRLFNSAVDDLPEMDCCTCKIFVASAVNGPPQCGHTGVDPPVYSTIFWSGMHRQTLTKSGQRKHAYHFTGVFLKSKR